MAASRTAEYVALFRAIESARPSGKRSFEDPYAAGFLEPGLKAVARASGLPGLRRLIPAFIDRRWPGARPSAVVRTRIIDDAVAETIGMGAEQMAILGAGYDTRGVRLPAARAIPVFELDQAEIQEKKAAKLQVMLGQLPPNLIFVPFDLEREGVGEPLARAGFVSGRHSVFLWEGVLSYLTPEAVDATLAWVREAGAPGSRLIFTYVDIAHFGPGGAGGNEVPWSAAVAKVGEPFRYGLDPAKLESFLVQRGLGLMWDLSTAQALGSDKAPNFYRIACAQAL
ncbi:MAG TPA: SAM-dependent methyltransferase [Solirubrobacterales bacterium]|nr:SAM-dependent methyltransferase [Solirubrobacterales bacterium]